MIGSADTAELDGFCHIAQALPDAVSFSLSVGMGRLRTVATQIGDHWQSMPSLR
jgi:hypothetical protein